MPFNSGALPVQPLALNSKQAKNGDSRRLRWSTRVNLLCLASLPWLNISCSVQSKHEDARVGAANAAKTSGSSQAAESGAQGSANGTAASSGGSAGATGAADPAGVARANFVAVLPTTYAAKIKNLMTGAGLTEAEYTSLGTTGANLGTLVGQWAKTPQWQARLLQFFTVTFQQGQVLDPDVYQGYYPTQPFETFSNHADLRVLSAVAEMFGRTALATVNAGQPFINLLTTRSFMMNTALKVLTTYRDAELSRTNWFNKEYPNFVARRTSSTTIPVSQSIDPNSGNFGVWYDPDPGTPNDAGCSAFTYATGNSNNIFSGGVTDSVTYVGNLLFGARFSDQGNCTSVPDGAALVTAADWSDWTMTTVRAPANATEKHTIFWNLPALRSATTLVVDNLEPMGFFSTAGFIAPKSPNDSNQYRQIVNEALVVANGQSFLNGNIVPPAPDLVSLKANPDEKAAELSSPCISCHVTLDPLRNFFVQSFDYGFNPQSDPIMQNLPTSFFLTGMTAPMTGSGGGIKDFANALTKSPNFSTSWVQKLLIFANSAPAAANDPELLRVANAFTNSNYNFNTLVTTLFTSPLVTGAAATGTTNNVQAGALRLQSLCLTLATRLSLTDPCNLTWNEDNITATGVTGNIVDLRQTIANALSVFPMDAYQRGKVDNASVHTPSVVTTVGLAQLCTQLAPFVVDNPPVSVYASTNVNTAISAMTSQLLGIPSPDPRYQPVLTALNSHYAAALAAASSAKNNGSLSAAALALQSTFVAACSSELTQSFGL